jgi:hypothetical protein
MTTSGTSSASERRLDKAIDRWRRRLAVGPHDRPREVRRLVAHSIVHFPRTRERAAGARPSGPFRIPPWRRRSPQPGKRSDPGLTPAGNAGRGAGSSRPRPEYASPPCPPRPCFTSRADVPASSHDGRVFAEYSFPRSTPKSRSAWFEVHASAARGFRHRRAIPPGWSASIIDTTPRGFTGLSRRHRLARRGTGRGGDCRVVPRAVGAPLVDTRFERASLYAHALPPDATSDPGETSTTSRVPLTRGVARSGRRQPAASAARPP